MSNSPNRLDNTTGLTRTTSNNNASNNNLRHPTSTNDLDQQAHQDSLFFESETNNISSTPEVQSSSRRRAHSTTIHHQQQATPSAQDHRQQSSAAATRFYRQHRNLSDASVDSAGGAYIDHRRPQPSPSVPSSAIRGIGASGGRGERGIRNLEGYSMMGGDGHANGNHRVHGSGLQRSTMGDSHRRSIVRGEEEDDDGNGPTSTSPRSFSTSPSRDDYDSSFSARTTRQQQQRSNAARDAFSSADLDEHAIEGEYDQDEEDGYLQRHQSSDSYRSQRRLSSSRNEIDDSHLPPRSTYSMDQISRPGSTNGKAEEDVCFPVNGAEVDLLDLGMTSMGMSGMGMGMGRGAGGGATPIDHEHDRHHGIGVPGVTSNFPIPFDFESLEEFAEREREKLPLPGVGKRGKFTANKDESATTGIRGRGMGGRGATNADGKTMRQRKLSESVAPGRFQRKLALFEGGNAGLDTASTPRSILDTASPLLAPPGPANGRIIDETYGSGGNDGKNAGSARPYRFSFYSNALPSTIHARSLAEIPAEGQTFEELFVGRQSPPPDLQQDEESYADEIRTAFSPPQPSNISQFGTETPTGQHSSRASLSGASKPPGFAGSNNNSNDMKSQPGRMRSEMDAETNTWWLDVMCPTDQEMKVLSKVFGIHPLTTEDIQMEETREKIELFRNYYFVCFRSFEQDSYSPTYLEPLNMYIIVFREGTLSFHFRGTPHPQNVRRRIKQLKDYINVTSDWISYALIDEVVDGFSKLIQDIEYEVDSIDELVLVLKEAEQSDMLRRIGTCRKKVMGLLRLMGNKADVVKGLYKRCNENWSVAPKSDIGLYLSDIQDHITTSTQNLTHYEKILSRSHSNYLAQISIEMTDANNEINNVLSKLTALGTILIPMNLITGLWGMNVHVPGQDITEGYTWFLGIIGFLAGIALIGAYASYTLFSRKA